MYVLHQQLREKRELHYEVRHLVGVVLGLAIFGGAMFYTGLLIGERYGAAGTFHDPELVYQTVFGADEDEKQGDGEVQHDSSEVEGREEAPELLHLEELGSLIPASAPRAKKSQDDEFAEEYGEVRDAEPGFGAKSGSDAAALAQQVLAEQARLAGEAAAEEKKARELREEQKRQAQIKAEQEKVAAEKAEQQRIAEANAEKERLARVRSEQERLAKLKVEKERAAKAKAEQERLAKLKADQERVAKAKAERERLQKLRAEQERVAKIKAAEERAAQVRAQKARMEKEKQEKELAQKKAKERKKLSAVIRSQGPLPLIHTLEATSSQTENTKAEQTAGPPSTEKAARSAQVKMSVSNRASRKFTLQLFSFQDKSLAATMVRTLKPYQGQKPYVTEVRKNESVWYRVHMGTFKTLGEARTFQKSIEASRGLANTFLVSK